MFLDHSEAGWAVIEEYEFDVLASNSEDERRIEIVERAAEMKVAKKRKLWENKTREMLSERVQRSWTLPSAIDIFHSN